MESFKLDQNYLVKLLRDDHLKASYHLMESEGFSH